MRKKKYAPRLRLKHRKRSPAHMDPLHLNEVRRIAQQAGVTQSNVLDGILEEFFRSHSPRYGEEY